MQGVNGDKGSSGAPGRESRVSFPAGSRRRTRRSHVNSLELGAGMAVRRPRTEATDSYPEILRMLAEHSSISSPEVRPAQVPAPDQRGHRFSIFIPDARKADLAPTGPYVIDAVVAALRAEGLPVDALGELGSRDLLLTKTASRQVLGS